MRLPRNSGTDFAVYLSPGISMTGADTGAAGTVHFEPGGVFFWSKAEESPPARPRRAEVTKVGQTKGRRPWLDKR